MDKICANCSNLRHSKADGRFTGVYCVVDAQVVAKRDKCPEDKEEYFVSRVVRQVKGEQPVPEKKVKKKAVKKKKTAKKKSTKKEKSDEKDV